MAIEWSLVGSKRPSPGTTAQSLSGSHPKENITAGKQWKTNRVSSWKLSTNHIPYSWVTSPSLKWVLNDTLSSCYRYQKCHHITQEEAIIPDRQGRETFPHLRGKVSAEKSVKAGGSEWSVTCDVISPVWIEILVGEKC